MKNKDEARKDLLAALTRLRASQPTHPDLVLAASEGKLKITPSSVALEARRSRTLIGMDDCKYPDIRREVLASKDQSQLQIKRSAAMKAMADEVRRLKDLVRARDSALAAAFLRLDDLESQLNDLNPSGTNVVSFKKNKADRA